MHSAAPKATSADPDDKTVFGSGIRQARRRGHDVPFTVYTPPGKPKPPHQRPPHELFQPQAAMARALSPLEQQHMYQAQHQQRLLMQQMQLVQFNRPTAPLIPRPKLLTWNSFVFSPERSYGLFIASIVGFKYLQLCRCGHWQKGSHDPGADTKVSRAHLGDQGECCNCRCSSHVCHATASRRLRCRRAAKIPSDESLLWGTSHHICLPSQTSH